MMRAHPAGPRHGEVMTVTEHAPIPVDAGALEALDPAIWPITANRHEGMMTVGGIPVAALAQEFGTPALILDELDFRARAAAFRDAFVPEDGIGDLPGDVSYASKAFLSTTTLRWLASEGLGLDVCTGGELAVALAGGFPVERITFHGNNKSDAELRVALAAGVGHYVIDSMDEIDRLATLAGATGIRARVLIRVTAGVEAHTHEFIATAHEDQKFGLSLASGVARAAVMAVIARPELELVGLHSHIGSQIFDASGFEVAAARVVAFAADLRIHEGISVSELNLGGGMGIAYVSGDDPIPPHQMARALRDIVLSECQRRGIPAPRLAVEPGRAIVGPAMITLYEVGTIKPVEYATGQVRTYVSVDGGMSDNIRTALYDAEYTITLASRSSDAAPMRARVVGKHCESGDIIVPDVWLPADLRRGDLLAVAATGAYCRSMASSYNFIGRPPVIAVRDGKAQVVLRRESVTDLLALDPGA